MWNHFAWNSIETLFSGAPLNAEIYMLFPVFSKDQKNVEMQNLLEKDFGSRFYFRSTYI